MEITRSILRRSRAFVAVFVVALMATAGIAQADTVSDDAATWLISQQVTSGPSAGAFPWTVGGSATPNTQGATALGLLRVYERSGNAAYLTAAIATGDCMLQGNACISGMQYGSNNSHHFYTHDALFLQQLSIDSGDPQYAQFVDTNYWTPLTNGTYGKFGNQTAADYASSIRSSGSIQELAAWDLSKVAIAAHLAGKTAIVNTVMQSVLASLNASDASHTTYDVVGLAGAIWASAVTGVDLDPTSGKWAAASSTADLAPMLINYQAPGGGFVANTSLPGGVTDANTDSQTTSYAMQALDAVDASAYATEINNGFASLASLQQSSGQFLAYPGASVNEQGGIETHGETMEAYAVIVLRPTDVYVDDDYAGDTFGDAETFTHPQVNGGSAMPVVFGQDAFATIIDALANVANGGNVYVAEGTYIEGNVASQQNLVIVRPVNLVGAQATVDARNRTETGASLILPAVGASPTYDDDDGTLLSIDSDGVTVDGFIFDGDNPAITSNLPMGTADPDVSVGMTASGSNIVVRNNVIRNLVYAGFYGFNYPTTMPAGTGNVIRHNWVHNLDAPSTWGIGIIAAYNYYADIDSNLLTDVRLGVQTNYFNKPAPANTDAFIRNNEVHASAMGIYFHYFVQNSSPFTTEDNQVFANGNIHADGLWNGISVSSFSGDSIGYVQNNIIDGSGLADPTRPQAGYRVVLITTTQSADLTIDGGSVSNVDDGVLVTDGASYPGAVDNIDVRNVAFSDLTRAAFYVEDTALAGAETTDFAPKLTIGAGNSFSNVPHEGALAGPQATIAYATGVPMLDTVLVRAANAGHRPGKEDANGNVRHVDNALINQGIAVAASGGMVDVEAGTFEQNVVLTHSVTVRGAMHGLSGFDSSRDGTGETVIHPASGNSLQVKAADATVDGFAFDGATVNQHVVTTAAGADDFQFVNNRITNVSGAAGITTRAGVAGWQIKHNLFENFSNVYSGSWKYAQALKFNSTAGGVIEDNSFLHVQSNAMQVELNTGPIQVIGNRVDGVTAAYTNVGIQVDSSTEVLVRDNSFANTQTGMFVNNGLVAGATKLVCNTVSDSNSAFRTYSFPQLGAEVSALVYDNAFSNVVRDISNGWIDANSLVVGSNYYDGNPPVVYGKAARVADPLAASPIGEAACGDNTPTQIVAVAGSGQNATINTAFTDALEVRVVDALGGAVMGQVVDFGTPANGASASFAAASGSTDFNGEFSTTATANAIAGSYDVTADSGSVSPGASFTLTNDPGAATITLDAGSLSAVYDGNAHAATATTDPAGLGYDVTYDGGSTVPVDAGSYAVVATINDANYTGTISGTLVISKASGSVTWGPLSFTYDGNAQSVTAQIAEEPATSCTVTPAAVGPDVGSYAVSAVCTGTNYDASGSETATIDQATATLALSDLTQTYDGSAKAATVTSTPAGVAHSVTYDGNSSAPSAVGDYAVVATITDANYTGAQVSGVLHIVAADAPDLAVTITDNRDFAQYGSLLTYQIIVSNTGNTDVTNATVNSVLPASLLHATPSWSCLTVSPGSSCASSGTGDLNDATLSIPANGGVVYLFNAWVNDDQNLSSDLISLKATVTAANDSDAGNNEATDETQAVIFRDGFEENSNGAQVVDSLVGPDRPFALDASNSQMLNLTQAWASDGSIVEVARLASGQSDKLRVQAIRIGDQLLVRLVGNAHDSQQLSAWTAVTSGTQQLAVAIAASGDQRMLLLVGGAEDLQVQLSDDAAALQVWSPAPTDS